jgi:hypothetical protein
MSIDTLTADTVTRQAPPQVARKNWETPIPNGIQENEPPDTGTVDMDFWDFVDIVNPLQHIPVVNTIGSIGVRSARLPMVEFVAY